MLLEGFHCSFQLILSFEEYYHSYKSFLFKRFLLLIIVVGYKEDPWYLESVASVSPHADFGDWDRLKKWERDRIGVKHLKQKVVYKFYRRKTVGN